MKTCIVCGLLYDGEQTLCYPCREIVDNTKDEASEREVKIQKMLLQVSKKKRKLLFETKCKICGESIFSTHFGFIEKCSSCILKGK